MKTSEELSALKEEVRHLNEKLSELTEEELKQVVGGLRLPGRTPFLRADAGDESRGNNL